MYTYAKHLKINFKFKNAIKKVLQRSRISARQSYLLKRLSSNCLHIYFYYFLILPLFKVIPNFKLCKPDLFYTFYNV